MIEQKPTKLPLLRSESPTEFLALQTRLTQAVKPQDALEEDLFDDFVTVSWEMKRIRRLKVGATQKVNAEALRKVLGHLLSETGALAPNKKATKLTQGWLENDPAAKKQVADIFSRFDLDWSAVEAEAVKLTLDQQQHYDRALAMASARRDKVLRMIMDYRGSDFAKQLRERSDQIINEPQDPQPLDGGDAEQMAAA